MSCFLHDSETFDAIYAYLKIRNFGHVWANIELSDKDFVQALAVWNVKAMLQRYGEKVRKEVEFMYDYKPRLSPRMLTDIEAFKLLQSIDYQCCDSDDYCKEFVPKMNAVCLTIAEELIRHLPGYEKARWS